ncbi:GDSL esterase/lipase At4g10955-like [Salvia miltiorrhiza]|uniref:GDSL esterase/lipase At4g10955-like n=1 Tax=Salvia miltiorrhiza TaxID=226208 RepID=UPI0025ABF3C1|nr:GDSL esterase/lipase At4g10955-like [Salvia miltiorrhiza]
MEHPHAFNVSGPRKLPSINWKDLINSTWKDPNYKRTVMACFIQAVYLLQLDAQENRSKENGLAPKWWKPFNYRLVEALIDERDASIFGAILEWDRAAALQQLLLIKPSGAPRAVLALRGTLLKAPTARRDIQDDLRFLAWESLKGSVRFAAGLTALRCLSDKYGSANVCIAGHSLGAGFALQIGKELAKQGVCVEAHLFNPPSVSFKSVGGMVWTRIKSLLPLRGGGDGSRSVVETEMKQWMPHLYVNNSDYICCYYSDAEVSGGAKVFVAAKGKQRFVEAHGLEQWWSDDLEMEMALNNSKLISRQLQSLYSSKNP